MALLSWAYLAYEQPSSILINSCQSIHLETLRSFLIVNGWFSSSQEPCFLYVTINEFQLYGQIQVSIQSLRHKKTIKKWYLTFWGFKRSWIVYNFSSEFKHPAKIISILVNCKKNYSYLAWKIFKTIIKSCICICIKINQTSNWKRTSKPTSPLI